MTSSEKTLGGGMVEDAPSSRITCKKQYDEDMHVH
jgi:hypothetical protein